MTISKQVWLRKWLWLVFWAGLFIIMHIPVPKGAGLPVSDKFLHGILYFALTLLGGRYQLANRRSSLRNLVLWALVFACYGGLDEWLQQFVNRTPSIEDWLADVAGVAAATLLLAANRRANEVSEPDPPSQASL